MTNGVMLLSKHDWNISSVDTTYIYIYIYMFKRLIITVHGPQDLQKYIEYGQYWII